MVRKKLIEVDLPLDAINAESKREKSIRHGHPSTLHIWWSRKPLAACRAVIFASMVDDPSSCPDEFPTEGEQRAERGRLHDIIRRMVRWESTDESRFESRSIQNEARYEIARSIARSRWEEPPRRDDPAGILRYLGDRAPPLHDPFAGGGSIPLEAQRLGLRAVASDLNPVAVLINKALIEIPPKFAGRPPVNPDAADISDGASWRGAAGLADDIRYYGKRMRDEAFRRIGHLYPRVQLPNGDEATVIAWLWCRTIPCPNPACGIMMPLMTTFQLSKKSRNEHWTRPIIDIKSRSVSFVVQDNDAGVPKAGTINRNGATCIACNTTSPLSYVREQSKAGNMSEQMTAVVAEGHNKKLFLSPTSEHAQTAKTAFPRGKPAGKLPKQALGFRVGAYGFTEWNDLFTGRQLTALTTFSGLISIMQPLLIKNGSDDEYASSITTLIALALGRCVHSYSSFARWQNGRETVAGVFARQTLSMMWDYAEVNPFSTSTQNWMAQIEWVAKAIENLPVNTNTGEAYQANAATSTYSKNRKIVVTDPPYYDNIGYADLSDFFYIWLRPQFHEIYRDLFSSMLVPKEEEMVAAPRFQNPGKRFEELMHSALQLIQRHISHEFPSSIFYAYKQEEETKEGRSSTGWETMLSAMASAGFQIVGTWPMRTELQGRLRSHDSNALASSVVLVCRIRSNNALVATRRQLVDALRSELPVALTSMQKGNIAPVDLAQASIGPGMAVFTRYSKVLDASGNIVSVRDALALINQTLDEVLTEQDGDFDTDTRWAVSWFTQSGFDSGDFGAAETLSKAKNTSVSGLTEAGILESGAGKVRLLRPRELPKEWDPKRDRRFTMWEATHHLIRVLDQGEVAAADMMSRLGPDAESARELAYRLYHVCEQKNRSQEARDYNALVQSWPEITRLTREITARQTPASAGMKQYDDS